jgi:hypothetical protein
MIGYLFRLMKTAFKNRRAEGETWDEIKTLYPRLPEADFNEIKAAIESEENNERN